MTTLALDQQLATTRPASQRCVSLVGWSGALSIGAAMWWMLFSLT
jgi:hypothetical protein